MTPLTLLPALTSRARPGQDDPESENRTAIDDATFSAAVLASIYLLSNAVFFTLGQGKSALASAPWLAHASFPGWWLTLLLTLHVARAAPPATARRTLLVAWIAFAGAVGLHFLAHQNDPAAWVALTPLTGELQALGYGDGFIRSYALHLQAMHLATCLALIAAARRHRDALVSSVAARSGPPLWAFAKAVVGRQYRQAGLAHPARLYHLLWYLTAFHVVGIGVSEALFGLAEMGGGRAYPPFVWVTAVTPALLAFPIWLHVAVKRARREQAGGEPPGSR